MRLIVLEGSVESPPARRQIMCGAAVLAGVEGGHHCVEDCSGAACCVGHPPVTNTAVQIRGSDTATILGACSHHYVLPGTCASGSIIALSICGMELLL